MKIHVLTFGSPHNMGPATKIDMQMLEKAAEDLGHELVTIFEKDCQLEFNGKPKVLIKNKKPRGIKILLVRANFIGNYMEYRSGVIKQFEYSGIKIVNRHLPVLRAKNKLRTLQILNKHKIPMPKTYLLRSQDYIDDVVADIGKFPVILKNIFGTHGSGVSIIESKRGLRSLVDMLTSASSSLPIMIQEYIKESKGKDIRVFIVGKRIVAAMERIATKRGEFRSNFKLGGRVRVAELTEEEKEYAFAAVKACGLDIAGVDILRTKNGPKILEVNANPGLEGISKATGRNVAEEVIKYAVEKSQVKKRVKKTKETKKEA